MSESFSEGTEATAERVACGGRLVGLAGFADGRIGSTAGVAMLDAMGAAGATPTSVAAGAFFGAGSGKFGSRSWAGTAACNVVSEAAFCGAATSTGAGWPSSVP